jgi:hypothetical protein
MDPEYLNFEHSTRSYTLFLITKQFNLLKMTCPTHQNNLSNLHISMLHKYVLVGDVALIRALSYHSKGPQKRCPRHKCFLMSKNR